MWQEDCEFQFLPFLVLIPVFNARNIKEFLTIAHRWDANLGPVQTPNYS